MRASWVTAVVGSTGLALVCGAVFLIAAVGSDSDPTDDGAGRWQQSIAWPVGVRRASDPRTAVVIYDVPTGQPDCVRSPQVRVAAETATAVHVTLTYELGRLDCTATTREEIHVSSRSGLWNRSVVVNGETWVPARAATYHRCGDRGCGQPTSEHCTDELLDDAMRVAGVPRRQLDRARTVRSCSDRWLITDVRLEECPDSGDECTDRDRVRRWFFEYRDGAWEALLGTRNRGCASVRDAQPEFPTRRCEDLPPLFLR